MKKILGIIAIFAFGAILSGCDDRRLKHKVKHHGQKHGQQHKGKFTDRLPGDNTPRAPNCAADGPGCRQMIQR